MTEIQLVELPDGVTHEKLARMLPRGGKFKDHTNKTYGPYTVVGFAGFIDTFSAWLISCKCGTETRIVRSNTICRLKKIKCDHPGRYSNDCLKEYQRIKNHAWPDIDAFVADVGEIDRSIHRVAAVEKSKPCGPENFQVVTLEEHRLLNTKRPYTLDGETKSMTGWAKDIGVSRERMRQRIKSYEQGKCTLREALKTPAGETCESKRKSEEARQERLKASKQFYQPVDKQEKFKRSCGSWDYATFVDGEVHVLDRGELSDKEVYGQLMNSKRYLGTEKLTMRTLGTKVMLQMEGATLPAWLAVEPTGCSISHGSTGQKKTAQ